MFRAIISALLTDMKPPTLLLTLPLLLFAFTPLRLSASDNTTPPSGTSAQSEFSADDFDWRDVVPYLFMASGLPGEQSIKAVLENSRVLRAYVADEVRAECRPDKGRCAANNDGLLEGEVTKRIDEIVQEGVFHRHQRAIVDYQLAHRPFPFSEIAAVKNEKQPEVYLILQLADHGYTAAELQEKYGPPYDTNIFQWYSVYKYRLDTARYSSKAVFEIDPVDGAVIRVAVSLKTKNRH